MRTANKWVQLHCYFYFGSQMGMEERVESYPKQAGIKEGKNQEINKSIQDTKDNVEQSCFITLKY